MILIFETSLKGHRLEYIHHLYNLAIKNINENFVFVLPSDFTEVSKLWDWPKQDNIKIELLEKTIDTNFSNNSMFSFLTSSYRRSHLLKKYCQKFNANIVFLNEIMPLLPFAPFIVKNVKLNGIIYKLYLYEKKNGRSKLLDVLKYKILANFKIFNKIFILNSRDGAKELNKIFKTNKFMALPDPFVPIPKQELSDFRKENNIDKDKFIFIHFGGMQNRKGTLEILKSIELLPLAESEKYVFVFAGKIYDDISIPFYKLLDKVKHKAQIIVKDEFCSYEYLASLCKSCNAILMPYKRTAQSSGLIGYAAQYGKPVVAPNSGLLGELVRSYHLGIIIEKSSPEELCKSYKLLQENNPYTIPNSYCKDNNIQKFIEVIEKVLLN